MSTKLDAMVGLLAGREVAPELREELDDPSSEASRFLEATRARSKALFGEPGGPAPAPKGRGRAVAAAGLVVAALAFFLGATLWLVDRRFRHLEATLDARESEARAEGRRLEALLSRRPGPSPAPSPVPSPPLDDALGRIEADLDRLEQRTRKLEPLQADDPGVARVLADMAAIRREVAAAEKAGAQRIEELQASVHDAARVLRLLLNRVDPPVPGTEPTPSHAPGFVPTRPNLPADPRRMKP